MSPNPGLEELLARNKGYGGAIQKMIDNGADLQKLSYVFSLRNVKAGWTLDQRKAYFGYIAEARSKSGGNSYQGFLNNIEKEAFENASEGDRLVIEAAGLRKPFKPKALPKPAGPGKEWTKEEILALEPKLKDRSFSNGQKMFEATRWSSAIGSTATAGDRPGPDPVGRPVQLQDMVEAIVEPSKVVSRPVPGVDRLDPER